MKYNIGYKMRIIANTNSHEFSIGQTVTIDSNCDKDGEYYCYDDTGDTWFVKESDMAPVYAGIGPTYTPHIYTGQKLEYGKYLVVRKDGKIHFEVYNGTGWAYNGKVIEQFYLPKIG